MVGVGLHGSVERVDFRCHRLPRRVFRPLAVQPGGKTIAVPLDNVLYLFDASSGRTKNTIPLAMHGHSIDITSDGAHWIIAGSAGLSALDVSQ
jgi:hypothetical protein